MAKDQTPNRTPPRARGKKPRRQRDWQSTFLDALAHSANVCASIRKARIQRSTAYEARGSDAAFAADWQDALQVACDGLELEARRRAKDGVRRPVYQAGKLVGYVREYSDTLLMFLLKAHRPEKYRETTRQENYNFDFTDLTDEQLDRIIAGENPLAVVAGNRSVEGGK